LSEATKNYGIILAMTVGALIVAATSLLYLWGNYQNDGGLNPEEIEGFILLFINIATQISVLFTARSIRRVEYQTNGGMPDAMNQILDEREVRKDAESH
jgi:hypothetical protein